MPSSALFTQKYTVILFSCQSICTLKKMPAPFFGYMYTIINLIISTWRSFSFMAFTKQCCQVRNLILLTYQLRSKPVAVLWMLAEDTRYLDQRQETLSPISTTGSRSISVPLFPLAPGMLRKAVIPWTQTDAMNAVGWLCS